LRPPERNVDAVVSANRQALDYCLDGDANDKNRIGVVRGDRDVLPCGRGAAAFHSI
jgi:hypothetical protein